MTLRINAPASEAGRKLPPSEAGFTLIEVLVVMVVLGMIAGLIAYRGPPRSRSLDLQAQTAEVARTLRAARSRAITANRLVSVTFDSVTHTFSVDGAVRPFPTGLANRSGIQFSPDGSSSGGRVELAAGERRQSVSVDWLTGRVSIGALP
jgi:general secretion pathway protein H